MALATSSALFTSIVLFSLSLTSLGMAQEHGATLAGKVLFQGDIPPPRTMQVTKDQDACGEFVTVQPVQQHENTHGLQQAIVSVEGIKGPRVPPPIPSNQIFNMKCAFLPRVGTAVKGDSIEVRNEDPILHNTHIKLGKRTILNVAQVPNARPIVKKMKKAGLHTIRCDKHTFMEGFLLVFDHPYFTQTNETGEFRIPNVPEGQYTLRVWHETLGTLEKSVTVPSQGTIVVPFTY